MYWYCSQCWCTLSDRAVFHSLFCNSTNPHVPVNRLGSALLFSLHIQWSPHSLWGCVFISRIRLKGNSPARRAHLQYSVRLFNVTHVALLTQGALLSMHCRAARDKKQMVRKWQICQKLLPYSTLVWVSVSAPSLCYQLYCTLSYDRIIRSHDTRFQHCCGHSKNYIAQLLGFLSTFHNLCMSVTAQLHNWQSMMLICSVCFVLYK